ncbi:MAG: DUF3795 domain-containing protein [Phycisphaerae bacterium]|nr:DUF3795 domain-containing protein [Phycisphaerae bacterium]
MTQRRTEIAPCGNHCAACQDFRVLVTNDDTLRKQVAANLTQETGRTIQPQDVGCEGCWGGIHNPLCASLECKIRQCADAKGLATCADCTDFPCPTYLVQFPEGSHCPTNIRAIKNTGLDTWLAQQETKRNGH